MKRAGGIITIITGLLVIIPAAITLFQGLFTARNDSTAESILIGGAGVIISFLVIILGKISIGANSKVPGIIIIIISILAIYLFTLTFILPLLSLVGGILIVIGDKKKISLQPID